MTAADESRRIPALDDSTSDSLLFSRRGRAGEWCTHHPARRCVLRLCFSSFVLTEVDDDGDDGDNNEDDCDDGDGDEEEDDADGPPSLACSTSEQEHDVVNVGSGPMARPFR
jgi:hypothetical protein